MLKKVNDTINNPKKLIILLFLIIGAFFMILPFYWMLSTSLKTLKDTMIFPPKWIPYPMQIKNYAETWSLAPFGMAFLNSIKIAVLTVFGGLITSSLAAYAFAKLDFPGRNIFFFLVVSTMIIPPQITLISNFILFKNLGWLNTHLTLIVPGALIYPLGIFLLRQFIINIPKSFEEAAYLDGCNTLEVYWYIILPMSKPALITVGILSFLQSWNGFLQPLVYLDSLDKFTITILMNFFNAQASMGAPKWHFLMAASAIAIIPPVFVFALAQNYIIRSYTLSGLKE